MRMLSFTLHFILVSASFAFGQTTFTYSYEPAAPLPGATVAHAGVRLDDGRVLVVGGYGKLFGLPLAVNLGRVYDPQTKQWQALESPMQVGRIAPGLCKLPHGRVLIAGGTGPDGSYLRDVELFDPKADSFIPVGIMAVSRKRPVLNALPDGRVLITGTRREAELAVADPNAPAGWRLIPLASHNHFLHEEHAALALADGSVLVIGGRTNHMERFIPGRNVFEPCEAALPEVIDDMAAIQLYNGKVLIAGGQRIYTSDCVANTWRYDPQADQLESGPELTPTAGGKSYPGASDIQAVDLFPGIPVKQGRYILLAGGEWDPGKVAHHQDSPLDSAWIYLAKENRLVPVGPMPHAHDDFAAVLLADSDPHVRRILLVGGYGPNDTFQSHCDLFLFQSAGFEP